MQQKQELGLLALCGVVLVTTVGNGSAAASGELSRFFVMGDGTLSISSTKNRHRFRGRYRSRNGRYITKSLRQINRVIGAPYRRPEARVSLRLIEALSKLRAGMRGKTVIISSGYRHPSKNKALRKKGRTVAKASLHQYGMAVDLRITGVESKKLWLYAQQQRIGGAGYYNGPWVHVDTGPVRYWTQGTANVRKGQSNENKRVILVPRYDRYRVGEIVRLRFARMTAYPIYVRSNFGLYREREKKRQQTLRPTFGKRRSRPCMRFDSMAQLSRVRVALPADLEAGSYRLEARFCRIRWPAMPRKIRSYRFEVQADR